MYELTISEWGKLSDTRPNFSYDDGKPVLDQGYVSATHSGDYSLIAYSDYEVGIDIEKIRDVSFARYFMGEIGKPFRSIRDFFREWTYREARYKAYAISVNRVTTNDLGIHPDFIDGYDMCVVGKGEILFSFSNND